MLWISALNLGQLFGTPDVANMVRMAIIKPMHKTSPTTNVAVVPVVGLRQRLIPQCRTSSAMPVYNNAAQIINSRAYTLLLTIFESSFLLKDTRSAPFKPAARNAPNACNALKTLSHDAILWYLFMGRVCVHAMLRADTDRRGLIEDRAYEHEKRRHGMETG